MFTHFSALLWVFVIPTCPTLSFSLIQICSHSFVSQKFLATYHSTRLLGDDYDDEEIQISYADENDSLEYKRQVGDQVEAPSRTYMGPPIFLPPGENRPSYPSTVPFTVDNVQGVLEACRQDIGTMFGYTAENRGVGITGAVDLVDIDGPILMIELSGRFWHPRHRVLQRIKTYMQTRIPELVDVLVSDESQMDDRDVVEAMEDSDAY
jgi:hypothetical protein